VVEVPASKLLVGQSGQLEKMGELPDSGDLNQWRHCDAVCSPIRVSVDRSSSPTGF